MAGKIYNFFREYMLFFSSLITVVGFFMFFIGAIRFLGPDFTKSLLGVDDAFLEWLIYPLIIGFILLITGVWYLYSYIKNRRFILEEIETKKRSEFQKRHAELKDVCKNMPSKYQKMLKKKERELNIK